MRTLYLILRAIVRGLLYLFVFIVFFSCVIWALKQVTEIIFRKDAMHYFNYFTFKGDQYTRVTHHYIGVNGEEEVVLSEIINGEYMATYHINTYKLPLESRKLPEREYISHEIGGIKGFLATYDVMWDGYSGVATDFVYEKDGRSFEVSTYDNSSFVFKPPEFWYSIQDTVKRIGYSNPSDEEIGFKTHFDFPEFSFDVHTSFYLSRYHPSYLNSASISIFDTDNFRNIGSLHLEVNEDPIPSLSPDERGVMWQQFDYKNHLAYRDPNTWETYIDYGNQFAHIYFQNEPTPYAISNTLMFKMLLESFEVKDGFYVKTKI